MESQSRVLVRRHASGNLAPFAAFKNDDGTLHDEGIDNAGQEDMIWAYERSNDLEAAPTGWKYETPRLRHSAGLPVMYRFSVHWFAPGDGARSDSCLGPRETAARIVDGRRRTD